MVEEPLVGAPAGLAQELAARRARPRRSWRENERTYSLLTAGPDLLFARYSSAPADVEVLSHEAAVRSLIGAHGALRAPGVLAQGPGWLLEQAIEPEPLRGPVAIDAAALAAERLAGIELPALGAGAPVPARETIKRRAAVLRSPLPLRDQFRAKRIVARCSLPLVTSHGDFHEGNILYAQGIAWVIDWELTRPRPAGYDLMTLWPSLRDEGDRERLWRAALDVVGPAHEADVARLRYALTVRTIANKLASRAAFNLDPAGGRRLLELLPQLRRQVAG